MAATDVFDDLTAEQDRLDVILGGLGDVGWATPSLAAGWTVNDVVLHLAQTEEAVVTTLASSTAERERANAPRGVDEWANQMVETERAAPGVVYERWRRARTAAVAALREADPGALVSWVGGSLKPATLATTRLAEHWAHGLDIAGGLGLPYPDTGRLRHVAWLGHRTLPYAFALAGEPPHDVFCELTGPDGETWRFGPTTADSAIRGDAGAFCRVGAQRLRPEDSGLVATGPHGPTALANLRNYAA